MVIKSLFRGIILLGNSDKVLAKETTKKKNSLVKEEIWLKAKEVKK